MPLRPKIHSLSVSGGRSVPVSGLEGHARQRRIRHRLWNKQRPDSQPGDGIEAQPGKLIRGQPLQYGHVPVGKPSQAGVLCWLLTLCAYVAAPLCWGSYLEAVPPWNRRGGWDVWREYLLAHDLLTALYEWDLVGAGSLVHPLTIPIPALVELQVALPQPV